MDDDLDFDQVEELMDRQQQEGGGMQGGGGNDGIRRGGEEEEGRIGRRRSSTWNNEISSRGGGRRGGVIEQQSNNDNEYYQHHQHHQQQQGGSDGDGDGGYYNNDNKLTHDRRDNGNYDSSDRYYKRSSSSRNRSSSRRPRRYNNVDNDDDDDEVKRRRGKSSSSTAAAVAGVGGGINNDERARMVQQAHRDDCTVMVMGIHPKCTEREVYVFMSQNAGKVRDVQVIRDPRTNRSKGVAYVEFYTPETILKALACNGQPLMGHPIRIQASQAEKNRAAEAARVVQNQQQDLPMRVYIGNLQGPLIHLQESELRKLFSPFGDIQSIEIAKSPYTGRPRGFAFVIYSRACDARVAIAAMHEYIIADTKLQVGYLASAVNTALLSQMETTTLNNNTQ